MRGPALFSGTAGRTGSGGGPGTERGIHKEIHNGQPLLGDLTDQLRPLPAFVFLKDSARYVLAYCDVYSSVT